jgi:hypothetical protein
MQITYELRQEDFLEAVAAHRNSKALAKWARRVFITIVGIFTAIILLNLLRLRSVEALKTTLPFLVLVVAWIVILWVLPRLAVRKQFLGQPAAQGLRTVTLDERGIRWSWNGGSTDVEWKNFVRSVEGEKQILLYTSPVCFNVLPKRVLTAEALGGVRELLEQNILRRK